MTDDPTPVVEIWRLPDGLTFDSVSDHVRELGYSPRRRRRRIQAGSDEVALILVAVAQTMGEAAAGVLTSSVAKWARGSSRADVPARFA